MKFIAPLKILIGRTKSFILNLNQYRNAHFRLLNDSKICYKKCLTAQIEKARPFSKAICIYKVFAKTKRRFDIGNVCSIHQKYFEDALVELGKLPDDNSRFIPMVIYINGGIDKDNPRMEIDVLDFNEKTIDRIKERLYNEIEDILKRGLDNGQ